MRKIGTYEYPELKATEVLEVIQTFQDKLGGKASTIDTFAQSIGHSTSKSGGFQHKLSDLRRYGLIEGRSDIKLTPLAHKILFPINPQDKENALTEMVFNVPLWKALKERLGSRSPSEDFGVILLDITHAGNDVIAQEKARISKLYIDAASKIKTGDVSMNPNVSPMLNTTQQRGMMQPLNTAQQQISNDVVVFMVDKINLSLPESITNLELIKMAVENRIKELREGEKGKKKGEKDLIDV